MAVRVTASDCSVGGQLHRANRDYLPRGSTNGDEEIEIRAHYKLKVVEERHRPKEKKFGRIVKKPRIGWHCHVEVTDVGNTFLRRGERANLLFLLNPDAENGDRVQFTYHNSRPGLIAINPYEWSRTARKKVYNIVERKLGRRHADELRGVPRGEISYPLMHP